MSFRKYLLYYTMISRSFPYVLGWARNAPAPTSDASVCATNFREKSGKWRIGAETSVFCVQTRHFIQNSKSF